MNFHPLALVFPPMEGVEFERFVDDIHRNGLVQPIILFQGQILDGRNRFRACQQLNIVPRYVEYDGKASPVQFVYSANVMRRHLSASQKACAALSYLEFFEKEAHQRQRFGGGAKRQKLDNCASSRDQVAAMFGISGRYVQTAKLVLLRDHKLFQQVFKGQLRLSQAHRQIQVHDLNRMAPEVRTYVTAKDIRSGRTVTLHTEIPMHIVTEILTHVTSGMIDQIALLAGQKEATA